MFLFVGLRDFVWVYSVACFVCACFVCFCDFDWLFSFARLFVCLFLCLVWLLLYLILCFCLVVFVVVLTLFVFVSYISESLVKNMFVVVFLVFFPLIYNFQQQKVFVPDLPEQPAINAISTVLQSGICITLSGNCTSQSTLVRYLAYQLLSMMLLLFDLLMYLCVVTFSTPNIQ